MQSGIALERKWYSRELVSGYRQRCRMRRIHGDIVAGDRGIEQERQENREKPGNQEKKEPLILRALPASSCFS